ncbi:hypothetical protein [Mycobacterium sp.]|jgi:hypothetical protein|uniref:hypothetical protein n=1 Tax=Mycobacterium sp. TaxID=1785 RepID=UPI0026398B5C|nr:hypothetical protein [Mycobacterium sp.]
MPKLLSRTALAVTAFKQVKKFLDSPRGQQLIAQAKTRANDPATRAKINEMVAKVRRKAAPR